MTCRKCKHLIVDPDKDGKIRPRKGNAYRCGYEVAMPVWPDAIVKAFGFRWPPNYRYMTADDGADCPCFEAKGA